MKEILYNLIIITLSLIILYYLLILFNINLSNTLNKFIIAIIFLDINGFGKVKDIYPKNYKYTYGEIQIEAMQNIFKEAQDNNISIFIDLGCGVGKGLVLAKFVGFKKVYGVEIVQERYEKAIRAISKLPKIDKNDIFIYNKDLFNFDLSQFRTPVAIFISNLVFPDDVNTRLFDYIINNSQKGTMIFCSKFHINEYDKPLRYEKLLNTPMSWAKNGKCFVLKII